MISTLFLIILGFTLGLLYSRGKADPVQSAVLDALRVIRKARDWAVSAYRNITASNG